MQTTDSPTACPASSVSLPWLASCVTNPDEFITSFWQTKPGIFRGACTHADRFTLSDVVSLIQRRAISPGQIRLLKEGLVGKMPDAQFLNRRSLPGIFGQGFTLNLNAVETALPAVSDLCTGLGRELDRLVSANVYLTPPSSYGLASHFDEHDVIVLQLQGEKDWQVFGRQADQPTAPQNVQPIGSPLLAVTLRQGDSLYVPRGFVHSVATTAKQSLHITLGIYPLRGAAARGR
jgi:ribosomal protein L16 Arg81 hydroxylase